jgi:hypothetical protein
VSARLRILFAALLLLGAALGLASCGSDEPTPLTPIVVDDTTTSMLTIDGVPRVSVLLDVSLTEATSDGAVTGSLRAIVEDSTGFRVFLPRVRVNGAALVDETDQLGNPAQQRLDIGAALPGFRLADTLSFAVEDGGDVTPPFALRLALSRVELLPDTSVVSKAAALRFRWSGRIERLILTLTDQFSTRVRANLSFENYSGLREVTLPARDLAVLAPGQITVAASITDNEARFPGPRLVTVNYLSTQRRTWTLTP